MPTWRRRIVAGLLVALGPTLTASPASAAHHRTPRWSAPVPGPVIESFHAPEARWAGGHRGVDYAAAPGDPVRAAGSGRVTFAGAVAGTLHVTTDHGDGLVTTVSFLRDVAVETGDRVLRGEVLGRAGGRDQSGRHDAWGVHFGARRGGSYIDPMVLLGPIDLTEVVRLVPIEWPSPEPAHDPHGDLRDSSYATQRSDDLPDWLRSEVWLEEERERRRSNFSRLTAGVGAVVHAGLDFGRTTVEVGLDAAESLPGAGAPVSWTRDTAEAVWRWSHADCVSASSHDGLPVNDHDGVFVGGINSSTQPLERNVLLDALYTREQQHQFSYRPDGDSYQAEDTYGSIDSAARALRDQLRALRSERPIEIDLVAHSMGGVVVRHFLDAYWSESDHTLPRIDKVVFISSPLEGAPLAGLGEAIADGPFAALRSAFGPPELGSAAVADLDPDSEISRAAREWSPPEGVEAVALAVPTDPIVPATSSDDISGVAHVPTHVGWNPATVHSDALTADSIIDRTATFVSGAGVPCAGFWEHVGGALGGHASTFFPGIVEAGLAGRLG